MGRHRPIPAELPVKYSTVAAPATFIPLATVNYAPSGSLNSAWTDLAITSTATNVKAIEFVFGPQQNGQVGYTELAVQGAALPVGTPLTWTGAASGAWDTAANELEDHRRRRPVQLCRRLRHHF